MPRRAGALALTLLLARAVAEAAPGSARAGDDAAGAPVAEAKPAKPAASASPAAEQAPTTPGELERRRRALDVEAAEVAEAKADLARAEAEVRARIAELKALLARQESLKKEILAARQSVTDARIARLAQIADRMSAKEAAAYLAGLEEDLAARILESLAVKKAALVTAALPPAKAAALSRLYLERDAVAPR